MSNRKSNAARGNEDRPKVAIICDWLTNMGGAERVVLALHEAYPDAPIYTSVYDPKAMKPFNGLDIRTTYLQKLPKKLRNRHQLFPLLRANAFRRLDLSEYDIIISSASAEAKAVRKRADAKHICYCHTPTRYYWSHYEEYKSSPGFGVINPAVRVALPLLVGLMRRIDLAAVKGVDQFIANSTEVQKRIKKYYRRESVVIHPPVDVERMRPKKPVKKEDYFVVVGRQVPYKRIDLPVQACTELGEKLIVIGNGPEHDKLVKMAGPTITFLTDVDDDEKIEYLQKAKAFIFPSEEDFGIAPVEAIAAGTPVITYGKGGALDYVDTSNGALFNNQTKESLISIIRNFKPLRYNQSDLTISSKQFSTNQYISLIHKILT